MNLIFRWLQYESYPFPLEALWSGELPPDEVPVQDFGIEIARLEGRNVTCYDSIKSSN